MSDTFMLKDAWKRDTDMPVAHLEADIWDSRFYTSDMLRTRIESFAEMCKMAKMAEAVF